MELGKSIQDGTILLRLSPRICARPPTFLTGYLETTSLDLIVLSRWHGLLSLHFCFSFLSGSPPPPNILTGRPSRQTGSTSADGSNRNPQSTRAGGRSTPKERRMNGPSALTKGPCAAPSLNRGTQAISHTPDIDKLHRAAVNTLRIPTTYAAWVEAPGPSSIQKARFRSWTISLHTRSASMGCM